MSNMTDGKKPISVGPWGGKGSLFDDGVYTGVRQLIVVHGAALESIQIEYDKKGSSLWSDKHGGGGGGSADTRIEKIKLNYPDEVLTSLGGYFGSVANGSPVIVQSLAFESNQAKYGPYGRQQGTHFSIPMKCVKIVGFHGRCGCYLDSIGVHLEPLRKPYLSNSLLPAQIGYNGDPVTIGPWGLRMAGPMLDDGVYTGVRQINLFTSLPGTTIVGIEVICDRHGQKMKGSRHGSPRILGFGLPKHEIIFDYPHEVLTHISGHYGPFWSFVDSAPPVINSLTFHTTKRQHGPFGAQEGIFFSSNTKAGMIVLASMGGLIKT